MKYNKASHKSKCDQREILGNSLCSSMSAEKLVRSNALNYREIYVAPDGDT